MKLGEDHDMLRSVRDYAPLKVDGNLTGVSFGDQNGSLRDHFSVPRGRKSASHDARAN